MRKFIRHPSDIPIEYRLLDETTSTRRRLRNISQGGLCFFTGEANAEVGRRIHITIRVQEPAYEVTGRVVWCRNANSHYDVGVEFDDSAAEFAMRMIEQICHIEHYKKRVLEKEGRVLSGDEAAREWIAKYAKDFPQ